MPFDPAPLKPEPAPGREKPDQAHIDLQAMLRRIAAKVASRQNRLPLAESYTLRITCE